MAHRMSFKENQKSAQNLVTLFSGEFPCSAGLVRIVRKLSSKEKLGKFENFIVEWFYI